MNYRLTSLRPHFVENTVSTFSTTDDILRFKSIIHATLTTEVDDLRRSGKYTI